MSQPAIQVEGLWKEYVVGQARQPNGTFYDVLASGLKAPLRRLRQLGSAGDDSTERFWALRDVNFAVQPGEVVGVIGRNGAGKSTLLKILSRITAPTRGRITVRGRLASLLEVGTGFHPELSGRENIYLNGSILGMSRAEVARKFDEIVAFAEVDKFIDTPVKRYSSGMYVRLAFAVAAHLDSDTLIIDEVLAVGDADFQKKCIGQMAALSKTGRTVLVVSHNMQIIQKICGRAILLQNGSVVLSDFVDSVLSKYLERGIGVSEWVPNAVDKEPFNYISVAVVPPRGYSVDSIPANLDFKIRFEFRVDRGISGRIACLIKNRHGIVILTSSDTDSDSFQNKRWLSGRYIEDCVIPAGFLVPGGYWITFSRPLLDGNEIIEDACHFLIDRVGSLVERDYREGLVAPILDWQAEKLE